jgi:antitoxin ParD1/3/4
LIIFGHDRYIDAGAGEIRRGAILNTGNYSSPQDVLEEGLKLIQAKEEYERRLMELRRDIQVGTDQVKRGEVIDGRKVIETLQKKIEKRRRTHQ